MKRTILLHEDDNVVTALEPLESGDVISLPQKNISVTVKEPIAFEHKVAICSMAAGDEVYKYGVPIGIATQAIEAGAHVHLHNLRSLMEQEENAPENI